MKDAAISFREAVEADLPSLIALLADDPLGARRETPGPEPTSAYRAAFQAIAADPNHLLLVADLEGKAVGLLQLSFLPHLTYEGGWRAQIEGVRIDKRVRAQGLGTLMLEHAINLARTRGCHLVQLTTDRRRPEALQFYSVVGFEPSHHGLKLHLSGRRA